MSLKWIDLDDRSVVYLNGSGPDEPASMGSVPRLVVFQLPGSTHWGTYCVVTNSAIPEMTPYWETREAAKRAVVDYALKALPDRWRSVLDNNLRCE